MNPLNDTRQLDAAIDLALARQPETLVPTDFAARVRTALPPAPVARQRVSAGRRTAIAATVVLLAAAFTIAPHMTPSFSSLAFDVELALLAELACILTWLAQPHHEL